jgi:hypothetical protein
MVFSPTGDPLRGLLDLSLMTEENEVFMYSFPSLFAWVNHLTLLSFPTCHPSLPHQPENVPGQKDTGREVESLGQTGKEFPNCRCHQRQGEGTGTEKYCLIHWLKVEDLGRWWWAVLPVQWRNLVYREGEGSWLAEKDGEQDAGIDWSPGSNCSWLSGHSSVCLTLSWIQWAITITLYLNNF